MTLYGPVTDPVAGSYGFAHTEAMPPEREGQPIKGGTEQTVKLKLSLPPLASHPTSGAPVRGVLDGEKAVPIRRLSDGVLVRLVSDDFLAVIMPDELV